MKLDFSKPVQTRDGKKVRIYAMDGTEPCPIHGAIYDDGSWECATWTKDGQYSINRISPNDLVNTPEEPKEYEMWLNMYPARCDGGFESRAHADNVACDGRIACIKVLFKEGDGL